MKPVTQHVLATTAVLLIASVAALALFVWSGVYNFAADEPHTAAVSSLLETMRERSIETRAQKVAMPDLGDEKRIVQGAGNYNAMCVGCHLAPGKAESEMSKGLYPTPPTLSQEQWEPDRAFGVIKHGIQAPGTPAGRAGRAWLAVSWGSAPGGGLRPGAAPARPLRLRGWWAPPAGRGPAGCCPGSCAAGTGFVVGRRVFLAWVARRSGMCQLAGRRPSDWTAWSAVAP